MVVNKNKVTKTMPISVFKYTVKEPYNCRLKESRMFRSR